MLRLILFFIILAALSFVGIWFAENQGDIAINWLGYHIETSVLVAVAALNLVIVGSIVLVELILFIKNIPAYIRRRRSASDTVRTLAVLTKGFAATMAGDVKQANLAAKEAHRLLGDKPIAHILSAETALLEGDNKKASAHFTALLEHKETEFIGIKGLLLEAREEKNIAQALSLAERAYGLKPDVKGVALTLLNLYKRAGRWDDAHLFLKKHLERKFFSFFTRRTIDFDVAHEKALTIFMLAKKHLINNEPDKALKLAEESFRLQQDFIPVALFAMDIAVKLEKKRKATAICETIWRTDPHPELARKYLKIYSEESKKKQVKRARKLLSINPDHLESHKIMAIAALANDDANTARNHLNLAIAASGETVSLCKLMADVEATAKETVRLVASWKSRADNALPDPAWSCNTCGSQIEDWQIECPDCGAIDSIIWNIRIIGKTQILPLRNVA